MWKIVDLNSLVPWRDEGVSPYLKFIPRLLRFLQPHFFSPNLSLADREVLLYQYKFNFLADKFPRSRQKDFD